MMHINTRLQTRRQKPKQPAVVFKAGILLLLLLFALYTFSGFTFVPNTTQTPNTATGTTLPRAVHMSEMLARSARDVGCSDVVIPEGFSLSGIRIYLNVCALQHLNAFVTSFGAGVIGLILLFGCQECGPLITWIGTIVSGITGGIDFLQIAVQGCSGVFLDISWSGGIKLEPACDTQTKTQ